MVFFATLYSTVNFCIVQSMLYRGGVGRRGWGANLEPLSHPSNYSERGGLCIDVSPRRAMEVDIISGESDIRVRTTFVFSRGDCWLELH